ncbi:pectate lyase [Pontibacter beigongshangensis]|uniref:pectate lyase n=1 Tax=Pontibacter beigongshangensis TaxID=2574733 RepID=UPI001F5132ED|nr:pectate lyase [Pontibacter beigongshangensis]
MSSEPALTAAGGVRLIDSKVSGVIERPFRFLPLAARSGSFCLVVALGLAGCAGGTNMAATDTATKHSETVMAADPVRWSQALEQEPDWYSGAEAVRIADNVLLYQNQNGGWLKNIDMAKVLSEPEKAHLKAEQANADAQTTIDNRATFTQMEYLLRVYKATGQEKFKKGFMRGLDYLLDAQYEDGGWAQFYPIRKGYYEHITFNDGAMMGVMRLLRDVSEGKGAYAVVDTERRQKAASAIGKGLNIILRTQIKVDGRLTAWCAQYDRHTLTPAKARAYELPSISGSESVGIVKYLMEIENPSPEVIRAVEGAVAWFEQAKLTGLRLERKKDTALYKGYDVVVVNDPGASPLWARFYEIGTNRPIFVGRDGIIRDHLSEIEQERRAGYSWYVNSPQALLEKSYPQWKQKWASRQ